MRLRWLEKLLVRYATAFSRDSRPLTEEERRDAVSIFAGTIDLDPVRIVRSPVVTICALGNVLRFPPDGEIDRVMLIHELAHVWQYQNRGTEYISNSVCHQLYGIVTTGTRRAAYRISPEDLTVSSIHDLPVEKQAVIIERWFGGLRHPAYRRFLTEVRQPKSS